MPKAAKPAKKAKSAPAKAKKAASKKGPRSTQISLSAVGTVLRHGGALNGNIAPSAKKGKKEKGSGIRVTKNAAVQARVLVDHVLKAVAEASKTLLGDKAKTVTADVLKHVVELRHMSSLSLSPLLHRLSSKSKGAERRPIPVAAVVRMFKAHLQMESSLRFSGDAKKCLANMVENLLTEIGRVATLIAVSCAKRKTISQIDIEVAATAMHIAV